MANKTVLTYTVQEVAAMLGIADKAIQQQIRKNKFPFPVLQVGETKGAKGNTKYLIPKKAVDDFLLHGKKYTLTEGVVQTHGRPRKWHKGEYITWTYKIPNDLAEAFRITVDAMNKGLASPLTYLDARLLALQEFIERRPIE